MTMIPHSIRVPGETLSYYEQLSKAYPHAYPTPADAERAALEFFKDFHQGAPNIEKHLVEGYVSNDPSVKRMVMDLPKDDYNSLRELKNLGRGVSVPELIRQLLREFVRTEFTRIQQEKEEQLRAAEAIRAQENRLNLQDSTLHR